MGQDPLQEVLPYYEQLEEIEAKREGASAAQADLFDIALQNCLAKVTELCATPEVTDALRAERDSYAAESQEIDYLQSTGFVDAALLERQRAALRERAQSSRFRLAGRILGPLSMQGLPVQGPDTGATGEAIGEPGPLDFFLRPPEVVAEELIGKQLNVKGKTAVVTKTLPQDPDYNAKWSADPIFGEDRVDVMVSPYRGHNILYVRAGDDQDTLSCVRIVGVELGGKAYSKATQVCKALGLDKPVVGSLQFDGETVKIVELKGLKK